MVVSIVLSGVITLISFLNVELKETEDLDDDQVRLNYRTLT